MCVWAFDYGADDVTLQNMIPSLKAIGDLDDSAEKVAAEIDYVREVTGSERANLAGQSQGGTHTKTYQQMYGTPEAVARVVTIDGNFHGTTLNGSLQGLLPIIINTLTLAASLAFTAGIQ